MFTFGLYLLLDFTMLIVSLHGIKLHAPHGLYPQELILGNDFEIDVDIWMPADNTHPWPFVDYTLIKGIVSNVFEQPNQLLEAFVHNIYAALKLNVPLSQKIKVAVRKMHPPMGGDVHFAQVCYEG